MNYFRQICGQFHCKNIRIDFFNLRLLIRPRFLQGISKLDPSIQLFGHTMKLPLLISTNMTQQDAEFCDSLLNGIIGKLFKSLQPLL